MSSLQKFHRRTQSMGPPPFTFTTIGSGDNTHGYWLGTAGDGVSKLIIAPISTEKNDSNSVWGSEGTLRGTNSTTDGLGNTNTLYTFGQVAHPAAYYCKTLSTGGYNTWYMPAKSELGTMYANRAATPFASANAFSTSFYTSSTEVNATDCWQQFVSGAGNGSNTGKHWTSVLRAVRRV
jgi:hypothetical protein